VCARSSSGRARPRAAIFCEKAADLDLGRAAPAWRQLGTAGVVLHLGFSGLRSRLRASVGDRRGPDRPLAALAITIDLARRSSMCDAQAGHSCL
jgi:hypothetical protein